MKAQAKLLKPKFDLVDKILHQELGDKQIARWSKPDGGYFISLDVPDGCARKTISLLADSGVILSPAGSGFPHGFDPADKNIRIAPTSPQLSQLRHAVEIICVCIEIIAIQKINR